MPEEKSLLERIDAHIQELNAYRERYAAQGLQPELVYPNNQEQLENRLDDQAAAYVELLTEVAATLRRLSISEDLGDSRGLQNGSLPTMTSVVEVLLMVKDFVQAPRAGKRHAELEASLLALNPERLVDQATDQMIINGLLQRIRAAESERRRCEPEGVPEVERILEEAQNDLKAWLCGTSTEAHP